MRTLLTMCSEGRYLLPFCTLCFHPYFQRTWSVVLVRLGRAMPNFAVTQFCEIRPNGVLGSS
jgi:hypothetical protein